MDPDMDKIVFDTVYFENDDYYEGYVLDRIPHGEGKMWYADGRVLAGKWIYGQYMSEGRDGSIPSDNAKSDIATANGITFCVGYCYDNDTISQAFGVSRFYRGIRAHHDTCVLLSMGSGVYKDGLGWAQDDDGGYVFTYTGEGLEGDQTLTSGNRFLYYSSGKYVYLFVKRKPNRYVFNGRVAVKRKYTVTEPDRLKRERKVYKFDLVRIRRFHLIYHQGQTEIKPWSCVEREGEQGDHRERRVLRP